MLFRFWVFPDCTFLDISRKAVIYARTGAQQSGCPVCAEKTKNQ